MNHWYILKIEKTQDKNAVKTAYMALLPNHNPETDQEGFTNLRKAYEDALKEIDNESKSEKDTDNPVSQFFVNINEIYSDFAKRIDPTHWEEALKSDVCTALDTEEEVDAKMMDFISRNHNLPTSVWNTLNIRFRWTDRADELRKRYSPGLINSIIGVVTSKFDLHYELFEYEPGADVDRFIFLRNSISQAIDNRKKDEVESLFEEIKSLGVCHPVYELEMARYLTISGQVEEAHGIIGSVLKNHPVFEDEPFAIYVKASVLLGFDDKERLDESLATYKKALEIIPNYYFAQLGIVDTLVKQEDYEEAEKYLVSVMLPENPSHAYLFSYLRHISELSLKKYEALHLENPTPENTEKLAQFYSRNNQHDKCIELLADIEKNNNVCYLLGYSYSKQKEYDLAIKYAQESIEKKPNYAAFILLSDIYFERRFYDKAIENTEQGLKAEISDEGAGILQKARLLTDKAYALKKLGKYNQALEVIDESMAINNKMTEAYADKAEILIDLGRLRDAYTEAEKALNLMPSWARPYEIMAEIFYRAGSYDQMSEVFTKTEEMQIKSHGLTYFTGCKAGAQKDYDKCIEILANLLKEEHLNIWEEKAIVAICHYAETAKNFETLAQYAQELINYHKKNDFPPTASSFSYLAEAYKGMDNPEKREEALKQGLEALPNNETLLSYLGYYYDSVKSPESYNNWNHLKKIAPKNPIPYNRLAILLKNDDKYEDAINILNKGLEEIPGNYNLLGRRGFTYSNMKEYKKAIDDFLLFAENMQNQRGWWAKAVMYFEAARIYWSELNEEETAIKYFMLAEEHGLEGNWNRSYLAGIYEWLKNYEKAVAIYSECIESDSKDDYNIYSRGYAYKCMGETEKANQDFETVIKIGSEIDETKKISHDTYRFIGYAYLEMDQPDNAKACFEKATEAIKTDGTKDGKCFCIYHNWAKYYMYIGEYQKALKQIDIAIGITNSVRNNKLRQEIMENLK
ncbi:MAG: tetratricopeptide repeat protein [Defluviitaleaceae bacterium]|nr:tetratricopeptide repeat protein [Defluviitaleaceae bacterium]